MNNYEKQMARVREAVKVLDEYVSTSEKPVGVRPDGEASVKLEMLQADVEYAMELLWRQYHKVKK